MMALDTRNTFVASAKRNLRPANSRSMSGDNAPPTDFNPGGKGGDPDPFNEACSLVWVNLAAYQDGELDPDTYQVVDTHIAHCNRCSAMLSDLNETDILIEREWREYPPLPSSFEVRRAIDDIMSELPPAVEAPQEFAPKRVHAKVRWMRFSTGFMGLIALFSLLWTSYRLGYSQGTQLNSYKTRPSGSASSTSSPSLTLAPTQSPKELSTALLPSASRISRTPSYTSSAVISRIHL